MGTWYASDSFNWSLLDTSKELLQNELKQTEKEFMRMVIQNGYLTKWTKKVGFLEMQTMTIKLQPLMQISTWTTD